MVVGGGIAGQSAIRELRKVAAPLVVVEPWEPMHARLTRFFVEQGLQRCRNRHQNGRRHPAATRSAWYSPTARAPAPPKRSATSSRSAPCAAAPRSPTSRSTRAASIAHPGYEDRDDAVAAREKYISLLGNDYSYYAEVNMPREEPHDASLMHGDASLPYVTALLALLGHLGTAQALSRYILSRDLKIFTDPAQVADLGLLDAFVQDLRNGLQLAFVGGELRLTDPDIAKDPVLAGWIRGCAAAGR